MNSTSFIIDDLKTMLINMGQVVWSNEKYTKMHDKLPIELFKVDNLLTLISKNNMQLQQIGFQYHVP